MKLTRAAVCVALAVATAGAAVPSTFAAPAPTAPSSAPVDVPIAVTGVQVARLITGDRVAITHQRGARDIVTLLPGSPHVHSNVVRTTTPHGVYMIPQLPAAEQAKLDPSLFNTAWLAAVAGPRVPVTVTFKRGVAPHAVAGLQLSFGSAHATAKGDVVEASYAKDSPGLDPAALAGVASIALRTAASVQHAAALAEPGDATHTLTVDVKGTQGGQLAYADSLIENVDDTSRYLETPPITNGVLKVHVPDGDYSVIVYTFHRLVIAPEFTVDGDTSVTLGMGDATVKPQVTLPGSVPINTALSVGRIPAKGFSFGLSFGGPHFFMRLQPTPAHVAEGRIDSGTSVDFVPQGERGHAAYSRVAVTADVQQGIPDSLTVTHTPADFAIVRQHLHANGPAGVRDTWLMALPPYLDLSSFAPIPAKVPSVRPAWLQASSKGYYEQALFPTENDKHWKAFAGLYKGSIYRRAGQAPGVNFAYGPVGPGIEAKLDVRDVGRYCVLCRDGDWINGELPLFSGAGSAMDGYLGRAGSGWSLRQDGTVLAQGHGEIDLHHQLPAEGGRYLLTGWSSPRSGIWTMSTRVTDAWSFASKEGHAVVPILVARYLPHTTLGGLMAPGHTSFRLTFANLGPVARTVASAAVSFSIDGGKTWKAANLTRVGDDAFRVGYTNPAPGSSPRYVSLRVTGVDTAGNRVTETALRVYRIR